MSICPICSTEFEQPKYRITKTCGRKCAGKLYQQTHSEMKNCETCDKEFSTPKSQAKKYCSNECRYAGQVGRSNPTGGNHAEITYYDRSCKVCGIEFKTKDKRKQSCSVECARIGQRKPKICPCGKEFWHGPRSENASKFCSDECRDKYGLTKKEKFKHATCYGCGEEFSRPQSYTSSMKYCSNECAKREQKKGWFKQPEFILDDFSKWVPRSGYEIRFYGTCLRFGIPIKPYDGPGIQTSVGTYRPDFIINDDTIVEVKGYMTEESSVKISETGILVIDKSVLLAFEQNGILPS